MHQRKGFVMTEDNNKTITFSIRDDKDAEIRRIMQIVYDALSEKGYNPINQIVGYLLSDDPTYITNHKSARALICRIERDDILSSMLHCYLGC